jgi:hypothetical protein
MKIVWVPTMSLLSPPKHTQDLFGQLPSELLLKIVKDAPSVSSLWSITQASAIVAVLFKKYAVEIVDTVIANTVPIPTQGLMRAVLRLRASSKESPCPFSLEEARQISYRKHTGRNISEEEYENLKLTRASCRLHQGELGGFRSITEFPSLAHKIHMLVHQCVDRGIQRCLSMRPATVIEWKGYCSSCPLEKIRSCYENSESRRYEPKAGGPPSWVEEQRTVRAFWRVELYLELKSASERGSIDWSANDMQILRSTSLSDFYVVREFEREQILTVYDYVNELGGSYGSDRLPKLAEGSKFFDGCPTASPFGFSVNKNRYEQCESFLEKRPRSFAFQELMAQDSKNTPVPGLPFQPYRKFGFALWDEKRMIDMGFSSGDGHQWLDRRAEYFFTWYSVLTKEEKNLPRAREPFQYGT